MTRRQPTTAQMDALDSFGLSGNVQADAATGAACELNRISARLVLEVTRDDETRDWRAIAELASRAGDMARLAQRNATKVADRLCPW